MAEFTRCNLSVLFLSKGKAKIVWLATSLIARKAAFLHKKELSGVVCLSFRPPTEFVIFCPINYRPVSLTSVVVKSLERLIQNHIMSFLSDNKLLCDNQHGFSCPSLSRRVAWYSWWVWLCGCNFSRLRKSLRLSLPSTPATKTLTLLNQGVNYWNVCQIS